MTSNRGKRKRTSVSPSRQKRSHIPKSASPQGSNTPQTPNMSQRTKKLRSLSKTDLGRYNDRVEGKMFQVKDFHRVEIMADGSMLLEAEWMPLWIPDRCIDVENKLARIDKVYWPYLEITGSKYEGKVHLELLTWEVQWIKSEDVKKDTLNKFMEEAGLDPAFMPIRHAEGIDTTSQSSASNADSPDIPTPVPVAQVVSPQEESSHALAMVNAVDHTQAADGELQADLPDPNGRLATSGNSLSSEPAMTEQRQEESGNGIQEHHERDESINALREQPNAMQGQIDELSRNSIVDRDEQPSLGASTSDMHGDVALPSRPTSNSGSTVATEEDRDSCHSEEDHGPAQSESGSDSSPDKA